MIGITGQNSIVETDDFVLVFGNVGNDVVFKYNCDYNTKIYNAIRYTPSKDYIYYCLKNNMDLISNTDINTETLSKIEIDLPTVFPSLINNLSLMYAGKTGEKNAYWINDDNNFKILNPDLWIDKFGDDVNNYDYNHSFKYYSDYMDFFDYFNMGRDKDNFLSEKNQEWQNQLLFPVMTKKTLYKYLESTKFWMNHIGDYPDFKNIISSLRVDTTDGTCPGTPVDAWMNNQPAIYFKDYTGNIDHSSIYQYQDTIGFNKYYQPASTILNYIMPPIYGTLYNTNINTWKFDNNYNLSAPRHLESVKVDGTTATDSMIIVDIFEKADLKLSRKMPNLFLIRDGNLQVDMITDSININTVNPNVMYKKHNNDEYLFITYVSHVCIKPLSQFIYNGPGKFPMFYDVRTNDDHTYNTIRHYTHTKNISYNWPVSLEFPVSGLLVADYIDLGISHRSQFRYKVPMLAKYKIINESPNIKLELEEAVALNKFYKTFYADKPSIPDRDYLPQPYTIHSGIKKPTDNPIKPETIDVLSGMDYTSDIIMSSIMEDTNITIAWIDSSLLRNKQYSGSHYYMFNSVADYYYYPNNNYVNIRISIYSNSNIDSLPRITPTCINLRPYLNSLNGSKYKLHACTQINLIKFNNLYYIIFNNLTTTGDGDNYAINATSGKYECYSFQISNETISSLIKVSLIDFPHTKSSGVNFFIKENILYLSFIEHLDQSWDGTTSNGVHFRSFKLNNNTFMHDDDLTSTAFRSKTGGPFFTVDENVEILSKPYPISNNAVNNYVPLPDSCNYPITNYMGCYYTKFSNGPDKIVGICVASNSNSTDEILNYDFDEKKYKTNQLIIDSSDNYCIVTTGDDLYLKRKPNLTELTGLDYAVSTYTFSIENNLDTKVTVNILDIDYLALNNLIGSKCNITVETIIKNENHDTLNGVLKEQKIATPDDCKSVVCTYILDRTKTQIVNKLYFTTTISVNSGDTLIIKKECSEYDYVPQTYNSDNSKAVWVDYNSPHPLISGYVLLPDYTAERFYYKTPTTNNIDLTKDKLFVTITDSDNKSVKSKTFTTNDQLNTFVEVGGGIKHISLCSNYKIQTKIYSYFSEHTFNSESIAYFSKDQYLNISDVSLTAIAKKQDDNEYETNYYIGDDTEQSKIDTPFSKFIFSNGVIQLKVTFTVSKNTDLYTNDNYIKAENQLAPNKMYLITYTKDSSLNSYLSESNNITYLSRDDTPEKYPNISSDSAKTLVNNYMNSDGVTVNNYPLELEKTLITNPKQYEKVCEISSTNKYGLLLILEYGIDDDLTYSGYNLTTIAKNNIKQFDFIK